MKQRMTSVFIMHETGTEIWEVPYGFGQEYVRNAEHELQLRRSEQLEDVSGRAIDLLGLVGYVATPETVMGWSFQRRVEAIVYATNVHLRASDNPLRRRHPQPAWFPEPWQGPAGEHPLDGPGPTPIVVTNQLSDVLRAR